MSLFQSAKIQAQACASRQLFTTTPLTRGLPLRAALLLAVLPGASWGSIMLDRIIVEFPHDQAPRQDMTVINESEEKAFVKIDVLAVNNPGEDNEERLSLAGAENLPFIASPSRLVIGPKGRKQIRLVNLHGPGETEQVYRVNVTPVMPPLENQEGAMVKVVIAYQALIITHPAHPEEKLDVVRAEKILRFVNAGNTYVMLSDGNQCNAQGGDCVDLPSRRLYAGNQWSIDLPYTTPVTFSVSSYRGARIDTF